MIVEHAQMKLVHLQPLFSEGQSGHPHDQSDGDGQKHQIPIPVKSETAAESSELPCLEHFSGILTDFRG